MDNDANNKLGYQPIVPYLELIDSIKSLDELLEVKAVLGKKGINAFFALGVSLDAMDTCINVAQLFNTALSMSREYYAREDDDSKKTGDI